MSKWCGAELGPVLSPSSEFFQFMPEHLGDRAIKPMDVVPKGQWH